MTTTALVPVTPPRTLVRVECPKCQHVEPTLLETGWEVLVICLKCAFRFEVDTRKTSHARSRKPWKYEPAATHADSAEFRKRMRRYEREIGR